MAGKLTPEDIMDAVDSIMGAQWQWGVSDCCMSAADVFLALHDIDVAAEVRGTYSDAIGAARVIRRWGGFERLAASFAAQSGLSVSNGACGDIGVSMHGVGNGPEKRSMLVCIEPGAWAGKTEMGYAIVDQAERCWGA